MIKDAFAGRRIVISTMHRKEKAIAPVLEDALGLDWIVPAGLDTDQLGTFSRHIPRRASMRRTVMEKARLGLSASGLDLAIASEGSVGPHPIVPYITIGTELLAFIDTTTGIRLIEQTTDPGPMARSWHVSEFEAFGPTLSQIGFPAQGLFIFADPNDPFLFFEKDFDSEADVRLAINLARARSKTGQVTIETDLRAHKNPRRMQTIRKLASNLACRLQRRCPKCDKPGWGKEKTLHGAPCKVCLSPTFGTRAHLFSCPSCGFQDELRQKDSEVFADPGLCPSCNP